MEDLKPIPSQHIGAQALLQSNCDHCGWLRRRKKLFNKFRGMPWMKFYVILHGGSVYCFWDERAKSPWAAFSLYGFNRVMRATDIPASEAPWVFKLEHMDEKVHTKYFSAAGEKDMKDWMQFMKSEMEMANKKSKSRPRSLESGSSEHYSDIEEPIYQTSESLQEDIYDSFEEDEHEDAGGGQYIAVLPEPEESSRSYTISDDRTPSDPNLASSSFEQDHAHRDKKMKAVGKFFKGIPSRLKALKKLGGSKSPSSPSSPEMRKKGNRSSAEGARDSAHSFDSQHQDCEGASAGAASETLEDSTSYWDKIWFKEDDNQKAMNLIRDRSEEGVFMVRQRDEPSTPYVLMVYADKLARKYKVHRDSETNELYLARETCFSDVEELLYHYFSNNLPNTSCHLSEPYFLHADHSS